MKDPDALTSDGADQPPKRLVRTTVLGIVCLVWFALSLCSIVMQVLQLTVLAEFQAQANRRLRQQMEAAQARAQAAVDAEVTALEQQQTEAEAANDAAAVAQLDAAIDRVRNRPLPPQNLQMLGMLKVQEMMESPKWKVWQLIGSAVGFVSTVLLGISGVGLLLRRRWGRTLGIGAAGVMLASAAIGMVTIPMLLNETGGLRGMFSNPMVITMGAAMCAGFGCGVGLPALMLVMLMSRAVREEFAAFAAFRGD